MKSEYLSINYSIGFRNEISVPTKEITIFGKDKRNVFCTLNNFYIESQHEGLCINGYETFINSESTGVKVGGQIPIMWGFNNDGYHILWAVPSRPVESRIHGVDYYLSDDPYDNIYNDRTCKKSDWLYGGDYPELPSPKKT